MTTSAEKKKLPNPVLMAAQKNEPEIVSAVLSHRIAPRIDVNERDDSGCSALGHVVQQGSGPAALAAAKALIDAGAKVDALEPDISGHSHWNRERGAYDHPMTPLVLLALRQWHGPWKLVLETLGAKKLKALSSELPLLHESLSRGLRAASELLVAAGADVNREDAKMGLPIVCCAAPADFAMLVAAGAKLNVVDTRGQSALQLISGSNASSELLSMATAAAQAQAQGQTVVFKEGQLSKTKASDEIAQPLIDALFAAIADKKAERVESLWKTLNLGRDKARLAEARDKNGQSLLHASLAARNFPLSRRLIRLGLSPNAFDDSGQSPLSILLGTSHQRSERDRSGEKRAKLCAELMEHVDWAATSPRGVCHYESLLCVSIERRNGVGAMTLLGLASAGRPDWLTMSEDGKNCLLSRTLARAVRARHVPSDSLFERQESSTPLHSLLQAQMERPEFGLPQAQALLTAALSAPQDASLQYIQHWLTKALDVIEAKLDVCKTVGVDPDQIAWSGRLASSRPTLFAAIESWRIAGVSRAMGAPRARAKSL